MTVPTPVSSSQAPPAREERSRGADTSAIERALSRYRERVAAHHGPVVEGKEEHPLLLIPDVAPTCQMLLLDQLVADLSEAERRAMLQFVRNRQDEASGAWLDDKGQPDLSQTVLAWWALVQYGADPGDPRMVRAARTVQRLGGAQRADLVTRIWLALARAIPWSFLPSIPAELWLAPAGAPVSPTRIAPWARDVLSAYFVLSRAPARVHLVAPRELVLYRDDGDPVPPRLTRDGLTGDLLQMFDRGVKLARKVPRGPLRHHAAARARAWLERGQSANGGWFGAVPTMLAVVALRAEGAQSNDPRVLRALAYLRRARGTVQSDGSMAQGLSAPQISDVALAIAGAPSRAGIDWLLAQSVDVPGPWQTLADAAPGGFSFDEGGHLHVDAAASALAVTTLRDIPESDPRAAETLGAIRRAVAVITAMQERNGSFARFERGETHPLLRILPWRDADRLAHGRPFDEEHLWTTGLALHALGQSGFRADDDRIARTLRAVERRPVETTSIRTTAVLHRGIAQVASEHPLRRALEHRLRTAQREDGGYGTTGRTAWALLGLLSHGPSCVQADRAAAWLADHADRTPDAEPVFGLGLSPVLRAVMEPDAVATLALATYLSRGARS